MGQPTVVHDFPGKPSPDAPPINRGETIEQLERTVAAVEDRSEGSLRITEAAPDVIGALEASLGIDADQFFTVRLLPHVETCSEEDCEQETRLGARLNDGESRELRPFCKDHIWVLFADFLVGA